MLKYFVIHRQVSYAISIHGYIMEATKYRIAPRVLPYTKAMLALREARVMRFALHNVVHNAIWAVSEP
jgi:hypothetical protein